MGATTSSQPQLINRTFAESTSAPATTTLPSPPPPPQPHRVETFEQKFYRKFTQEPLVPIGCLVTAYFLGSGIKSFYNRDAARSQRMMRARVAAQFTTLAIFIGYYGISSFDLTLAPRYQAAKKHKEMMEQQQVSSTTPSATIIKQEKKE